MTFFDSLFGKKGEDTAIGIDIGSSAIKIVQLSRKKGKVMLDTYGALSLGPYAGVEIGKPTNLSVGKLAEALTDILGEAKVTTKVGAISIPFNASLMKVIELPAASARHLKEIIPIEAKKYIPVPISEVSLDWSIVKSGSHTDFSKEQQHNNENNKNEVSEKKDDRPLNQNHTEVGKDQKEKTETIHVLIVAIHNDVIKKFRNIVSASSLDADFFEIEIYSTLRSVLSEDSAPTMIIDVGSSLTKLYIVESGNIESSHTINKGSQDITDNIKRALGISVEEAEILKRTRGLLNPRENQELHDAISSVLDYIFSETLKMLREYQERSRKVVNKVFLVGGGSAMRGFPEAAKANFQLDVEPGNPFSKVEAPAYVSDILRNNGPEFAVAVGMALRRLEEGV